MPYVALSLPPGFYRPGTLYQARGRWYDGTLVRWHDGAMQPVGGWQALERIDSPVAAALSSDGGVFTSETTDANSAGANDVVLIPASPQTNDAFYVGAAYPFSSLDISVGTAATGGVITWEYYNGSAWASLSGVSDATVGFTAAGRNVVSFTRPSDWTATTVNSVGPYFYLRARVTTAGSTTGLGTQIWINSGQIDFDAPARGMAAWRANDESTQLAAGTAYKLWQYSNGVQADITPSGFSAGGEDAVLSSATYGSGLYGSGLYGTGDQSQATLVEANTWSMDTFGEDLVACAYSDGYINYWDKSAGGVAVRVSSGNTVSGNVVDAFAPTSNLGVVVTPERFIVALGAGGDGRMLQWADQESATVWENLNTNQAGAFSLPGSGQIMAGRRTRSETLIWTDQDLFTMSYIGGELIYSFRQVAAACGVISRMAMAVAGDKAAWMGQRGFFVYDGYFRPMPCEVGDYVFGDLNRVQASKVWAQTTGEFNEVTWYYPSSGSTECDRYVSWNYLTDHWTYGTLARTAGVDRGAFPYPLKVDASGLCWQHEVGSTYTGATEPNASSGPLELGAGDNVMMVRYLVPDEVTLGSVELSLIHSLYPTADETTAGPYTMAEPTPVRITARQVRVKAEHVSAGWRLGSPRLEVVPGGLR